LQVCWHKKTKNISKLFLAAQTFVPAGKSLPGKNLRAYVVRANVFRANVIEPINMMGIFEKRGMLFLLSMNEVITFYERS
jgi:hypothetical protein